MDGVLNVHKPSGPTSHDVVAEIRRVYGQKKVGHCGTLDPLAEGVLVLCLGRATRIVQYLMGSGKDYRSRMVLGATTDTQDITGQVMETRDASGVTLEQMLEAAQAFVGEIEQVPPMVSAIKHQGRRLYELARDGKSVERKPRPITVHSLDVLEFVTGSAAEAEIYVRCTSGTYIRTLCADIGEGLGCGAYMKSLVRTRVGAFGIEESLQLSELADASRDQLADYLTDMGEALSDMPSVALRDAEARAIVHGLAVSVETPCAEGESVRLLAPDGSTVGVGLVSLTDSGRVVVPKTVLVDPLCL